MNDKSITSYRDLKDILSVRQAEVLQVIQHLGPSTNRMIARYVDLDINRVTGRVKELREKGLVVYAGDYFDKETARTVNLWKTV